MNKLYYLLLIPLIRFIINLNQFFYLRTALGKQYLFLNDKNSENEKIKNKAKKAGDWVQAHQLEIKKSVLNTGIDDHIKSYMQPVGLGYGQQQNISALDNLLFMNKELIESSREILTRAKGHYKIQAFRSLSPLFWIEYFVFMPREIIKKAGFETNDKPYVNVIQIIYWIVVIIYTLIQIKNT